MEVLDPEEPSVVPMRTFSVTLTVVRPEGSGSYGLHCRGIVAVIYQCERCLKDFSTEELLKGHYSFCDSQIPKLVQKGSSVFCLEHSEKETCAERNVFPTTLEKPLPKKDKPASGKTEQTHKGDNNVAGGKILRSLLKEGVSSVTSHSDNKIAAVDASSNETRDITGDNSGSAGDNSTGDSETRDITAVNSASAGDNSTGDSETRDITVDNSRCAGDSSIGDSETRDITADDGGLFTNNCISELETRRITVDNNGGNSTDEPEHRDITMDRNEQIGDNCTRESRDVIGENTGGPKSTIETVKHKSTGVRVKLSYTNPQDSRHTHYLDIPQVLISGDLSRSRHNEMYAVMKLDQREEYLQLNLDEDSEELKSTEKLGRGQRKKVKKMTFDLDCGKNDPKDTCLMSPLKEKEPLPNKRKSAMPRKVLQGNKSVTRVDPQETENKMNKGKRANIKKSNEFTPGAKTSSSNTSKKPSGAKKNDNVIKQSSGNNAESRKAKKVKEPTAGLDQINKEEVGEILPEAPAESNKRSRKRNSGATQKKTKAEKDSPDDGLMLKKTRVDDNPDEQTVKTEKQKSQSRDKKTHNSEEKVLKPDKKRKTQKPRMCELCGQLMASQASLKTHLMKHAGIKQFVCDTCGDGFITKTALSMHLKAKHSETDPKKYLCTYCGKSFTFVGHCRQHIRDVHESAPVPCTYKGCGKVLQNQKSLVIHMRTHTRDYRYMCAICGKGFIHSGTFKHHRMSHAGEKPHPCPLCEKKFISKTKLRRHLKVHKKKNEIPQDFYDFKPPKQYRNAEGRTVVYKGSGDISMAMQVDGKLVLEEGGIFEVNSENNIKADTDRIATMCGGISSHVDNSNSGAVEIGDNAAVDNNGSISVAIQGNETAEDVTAAENVSVVTVSSDAVNSEGSVLMDESGNIYALEVVDDESNIVIDSAGNLQVENVVWV